MAFKDYIPSISIQFGKKSIKSSTDLVAKQNLQHFANLSKQLTSTYINSGVPVWRNLSELAYLLDCYEDNPVVQSIINIDADASSNRKYFVEILKTGEQIPLSQYKGDEGQLYNLISQPNPLQSTKEWIKQFKVCKNVFGEGFMYANIPDGFSENWDYKDIISLNNLPPYLVTPQLTGKWLSATEKKEIVSSYLFRNFNNKEEPLYPERILHLNDVNIRFNQDFTRGKSKLLALKMPITNIQKAFESRNVLIMKRAPLGIFSSGNKDEALGSLPLREEDIETAQKELSGYGLLDGQNTHIITSQPLVYQKTGSNVKELMLFEEVESDAIAVAVAYGVPELLVKYYIKGGTFENLNASEKRLYDSKIIPESEEFDDGLNKLLKLKDFGIRLFSSYSHVNVLQNDKKQESEINYKKQEIAKDRFLSGLISYGQYAIEVEVQLEDKSLEKKYVWDLEENQLKAIGINNSKSGKDE